MGYFYCSLSALLTWQFLTLSCWVLLTGKLPNPLKNDGWKMKFPFEVSLFRWHLLISERWMGPSCCWWKKHRATCCSWHSMNMIFDFVHINWCRISPINSIINCPTIILGHGFKYIFFHPYLGKIPNLTNIFQMGCKPPTSIGPPWSCVCLQSIVPQGWFLDECPWFAGAYLLAVGGKRRRLAGRRTKVSCISSQPTTKLNEATCEEGCCFQQIPLLCCPST